MPRHRETTLSVRVLQSSKDRLITLAEKLDLSLSDVTRQALARGLAEMERERR